MFDLLKVKKENDDLFEIGTFDGMTSEYYKDYDISGTPRAEHYRVDEHTVKMNTIECILANAPKRCLALNFANPVHAGGGYIYGAKAQEEDICRASGLYFAIREVKKYYTDNIAHYPRGCTDNFIYTENVPVVRDDKYNMLKTPVLADFITSAAVNRYGSAVSHKHANEIMERRIRKFISFCAVKNPQVLILGAYGCGAFGNRRDEVLPMFERAINDLTGECTSDIVFAIP